MPYILKMYVDSDCRRNDDSGAIGAAACVIGRKEEDTDTRYSSRRKPNEKESGDHRIHTCITTSPSEI